MSPKTTAETTDRTTTARLLLVIIFALVAGMALLLSPASVQTADAAQVHKIRTAAQWHDIGKYNGGTFKIMNNIKLTSESQYLTISKNKKYTIDFNGKTVKTTYTGVALRTTAPLCVNKGTMVIKTSNKKGKGVLYSTETAAVVLQGNAKLYFKSGSIVDDATEFRSDITSAIMTYDNSKCYLQGKCKIQSIGNGVALMGASKLYATGNPYVRAGANTYTGQFTHYGSGISIASKNARISLKGGSYGTKATPDAIVNTLGTYYFYPQSANYPLLDQYGQAIGSALKTGYKFVDASGTEMAIWDMTYSTGSDAAMYSSYLEALGMNSKRVMCYKKSSDGYYTIYVKCTKAKNSVTAKATAKSVKGSTVKKKAAKVAPIKASGKTKLTYTISKWTTPAAKGHFSVNKTTGKVTIPKGTKKGTYTIKVKVVAKKGTNYKALSTERPPRP